VRTFGQTGTRWLLLPLALIVCLLTAGNAAAQAVGEPVTIVMGEQGSAYFFQPREVTVPTGAVRFLFRNEGGRRHNWVVRLPGGDQRTPDLNAGQTHEQTFTFAQPGTYDVLCDLPTHAQRGMTMRLTVAGGAAAPAVPAAPAAPAVPTQVGPSPSGWPLLVSLAIHIPSAVAWLGIVVFDAFVVAVPFLTPAQRGALLLRPRWIILATIPLFTVTGIYQTIYNPFGTITTYADLSALRTDTVYGLALFWKHGFVVASMALTLAVTFWFAPRLITFADAAHPVKTPFGIPALLTWANVAACLALLACVAVMVYQLH
jgi:plastocyanin